MLDDTYRDSRFRNTVSAIAGTSLMPSKMVHYEAFLTRIGSFLTGEELGKTSATPLSTNVS